MPSVGVPGPDHLVAAVDTSGSMSDDILSQVLAELDTLRNMTECTLTLIQCDADIQKVETFNPYEESSFSRSGEVVKYQFHGRGGTDLRPPFNWVTKRILSGEIAIDAMFYLTDGFGAMPEKHPGFPVVWMVPETGVDDVPFGMMMRI